MSYLEKTLMADETIVYRTKKHIILFFTPFIWTLVTLIMASNSNDLIHKAALIPAFAALIIGLKQLLVYISSDFIITNKRVLMKEGFFFRHANETRLTTISNVTIDQSLLGQLFNYGTINLNSFGGGNDPFAEINNPVQFQKKVAEQLDNSKQL